MNQTIIRPNSGALIVPSEPASLQTKMGRIEQVLVGGDLSKLTQAERETYYLETCKTLSLNPLTRPFDYITLSGRLVLYANKGCAEQLRSVRKISISVTAREVITDLFVVTANAKGPDGREDSSTGAVNIAGLKGDMLANAMMKAETKAKRRVTLSICGLNMLDESEVDSIPNATRSGIFPEQPPSDCGVQLTTYCPKYGRFAKRHLENCEPAEMQEEILKYEAEAKAKGRDVLPWQAEFIKHAEPLIADWEQQEAAKLRGGES